MKLSHLFVLSAAAVVPAGALGADPQVDLRTNLGTIRLRAAGEEKTSVAIAAEPSDHPDQQKLTAVFEKFVRQVEGRFQAAGR